MSLPTKQQMYAHLQQTAWKKDLATTPFGHITKKIDDQIEAAYKKQIELEKKPKAQTAPPTPPPARPPAPPTETKE